VAENLAHDLLRLDGGDQRHPAAAAGTRKHVEIEERAARTWTASTARRRRSAGEKPDKAIDILKLMLR